MMMDVQNIRRAYKEKMKKYPVAKVYLQVLGSGAPGAPKALYVFTDQCRYLFNCGEGTQRLAYEHKVNLSSMEHVLITYNSWENVGGLPGALLTLQDTGVPEISIHGPPGLKSLYSDGINFMSLASLKLNYHHHEYNQGIFEEGPLIITSIPICSKVKPDLLNVQDKTDMNRIFLSEKSLDNGTNENFNLEDLAIIYICRPTPKPGALLPDKCKSLGVPKGPLFGELKRGCSVTLPNGTVIDTKDVTEPDDPGPVFIVMEVPTSLHLSALLKVKGFEAYQEKTAKNENDIAQIIIHFSPPEVVKDQRYQDWIHRFPISTSHLYLNEKNTCMGSERVHKIQYKLNHLYPNSFPILKDTGIKCKNSRLNSETNFSSIVKKLKYSNNNDLREKSKSVLHGDENITVKHSTNFPINKIESNEPFEASTLLMYHIRPHLKYDYSLCLTLDSKTYIDECYKDGSFKTAYFEVKKKLLDIESLLSTEVKGKQYPNLIFLGTGSCIPNKTRNTSGIAFNISDTSSMILDCGEGTYGQLVRFMGVDEADKFLRKLKGIYVSHKHADHHIGLIRLLLARKESFLKVNLKVSKLYLLAPSIISDYLNLYDNKFGSIKELFILVLNKEFNANNELFNNEANLKVYDYLEVRSIETCLVWHCKDAYGVSIILKDGWKMVYSGDTTPCQPLINIGMDCDLLIHEATMEDELMEDAKLKKHSTTSGALQTALEMKAKHIILTHFSQRYSKVPLLKDVPENVSVAFDNMQVHLRDMACLPHLYPAYVALFSEDYNEMIEKTRKRKARELEGNKTLHKESILKNSL